MPASTSAALRSDRRRAIVQVAHRLIADRGLEGLRFGDVAREAGINNGTLLYYFASKEALIQGVVAYLVDEFSTSHASLAPPSSSTLPAPAGPLTDLRVEFEDARGRLRQPLGVVYVELLARAQRDEVVAGALRDMDDAWRGWLVSILERGRQQHLFRADLDASVVATLMMGAIRGLGLQAVSTRDPHALEHAMHALAGLIEAWLVTPSTARPSRRTARR